MNVFDALEEAGMGILDATGSATANVVEKRFGSDMAGMVCFNLIMLHFSTILDLLEVIILFLRYFCICLFFLGLR